MTLPNNRLYLPFHQLLRSDVVPLTLWLRPSTFRPKSGYSRLLFYKTLVIHVQFLTSILRKSGVFLIPSTPSLPFPGNYHIISTTLKWGLSCGLSKITKLKKKDRTDKDHSESSIEVPGETVYRLTTIYTTEVRRDIIGSTLRTEIKLQNFSLRYVDFLNFLCRRN